MKGKKGTKVGDGLANANNKYFNMERCVCTCVCVYVVRERVVCQVI